ncbi:MAG: phosphoglycolate phosphatase [Sphingomonadales bacterium]
MKPNHDLNSNKTQPLLIFDLDGTLVDTAPDLTHALNHVLASISRPHVALEDVRHMVGHGAMAMIKLGTAATGQEITNEAERQILLQRYLDYYSAHIFEGSQAFPNMIETLDYFRASGHNLAICTNKPTALSVQLIEAMGLTDYFKVNLGADSVVQRKPHAEHLLETIKQAGGTQDNAIMIGDSETDFKTARNAGIPIVMVDFGYSDNPVESLGADAVISDFSELKSLIPDLMAR